MNTPLENKTLAIQTVDPLTGETVAHVFPAATIIERIPGYSPIGTADDCVFDENRAQRALDFFPDTLHHVEGEKGGQPFYLELWQASIIANLFGWLRPDGTRRYRQSLIYVPRKNGKTALAAGVVLYLLIADNEPGPRIYSTASTREQAALIFSVARGMIRKNPELDAFCRIHKTGKTIEANHEQNWYTALSSEAGAHHGLNPSAVIDDELHAHKKRDLIDVMNTALGARSQPLTLYLTTADYMRESICNEVYDKAASIRDGVYTETEFLPVIYEALAIDDWKDPEVWFRANPNLDVSKKIEYMESQCREAERQPSFLNEFLRLHLNVRTETSERWIDSNHWNLCGGDFSVPELEKMLEGHSCFAALDLSSTKDTTAFILAFDLEGKIYFIPRIFVPAAWAKDRKNPLSDQYLAWARDGYLILTPGDRIDYGWIRQEILNLSERYKIREIAYDPWNADQLAIQLDETDGFKMIQFRQGYASLNGPSKAFESAIVNKTIVHGNHPVLSWQANNVCVEHDPAGNIKPSKKTSNQKIDGIVAAIMAYARATVSVPEKPSIYESRGPLTF